MSSTFEELLEKDGRLVYRIRGVSMMPLLRQKRDLVVIEPAKGRLKKYDTALYRRGRSYVLHRVIGVTEKGYLIRGDNTYTIEKVPEGDVIGVLTQFSRGGKSHSVTEKGYLLYVRLWDGIYPLRAAVMRLGSLLITFLRKTGLYTVVRGIIKHE